jgi:hypothetical protein
VDALVRYLSIVTSFLHKAQIIFLPFRSCADAYNYISAEPLSARDLGDQNPPSKLNRGGMRDFPALQCRDLRLPGFQAE